MLLLLEKPGLLLRLEGLAAFILALVLYRQFGQGWTLFWSTVLLPDLAMLGYLAGPRIGAHCYNFTHTKLLPAMLAGVGLFTGASLPVALALIWFVHIGFDRMLGYGLKYPEGFKVTHLGTLGKKAASPGAGSCPVRSEGESKGSQSRCSEDPSGTDPVRCVNLRLRALHLRWGKNESTDQCHYPRGQRS